MGLDSKASVAPLTLDMGTHIIGGAVSKEIRWTPGTNKDLRELEEDVRLGFG
jgi:hypothetical protein